MCDADALSKYPEGIVKEPCVAHVIRHTPHATRHTSHVTRHTPHVTRLTPHVTRHTSHVTRHMSHATRHTSHATRHTPLQASSVAEILRQRGCAQQGALGAPLTYGLLPPPQTIPNEINLQGASLLTWAAQRWVGGLPCSIPPPAEGVVAPANAIVTRQSRADKKANGQRVFST